MNYSGDFWEKKEDVYLSGYATGSRIAFDSLSEAKEECLKTSGCGGITLSSGDYELRHGSVFEPSPTGEISWKLSAEQTTTGYKTMLQPPTH